MRRHRWLYLVNSLHCLKLSTYFSTHAAYNKYNKCEYSTAKKRLKSLYGEYRAQLNLWFILLIDLDVGWSLNLSKWQLSQCYGNACAMPCHGWQIIITASQMFSQLNYAHRHQSVIDTPAYTIHNSNELRAIINFEPVPILTIWISLLLLFSIVDHHCHYHIRFSSEVYFGIVVISAVRIDSRRTVKVVRFYRSRESITFRSVSWQTDTI